MSNRPESKQAQCDRAVIDVLARCGHDDHKIAELMGTTLHRVRLVRYGYECARKCEVSVDTGDGRPIAGRPAWRQDDPIPPLDARDIQEIRDKAHDLVIAIGGHPLAEID